MSRRYSDILKAARDLPYLENYIKWMTSAENRQPNIGKRGARKASQKLGVIPFNVPLGAGQLAYESGALPTWEAHRGEIGNHAVALTATNIKTTVRLERYSAARVIILTGRGATGTEKVSHITGRKYMSHGGTSTSLPFGKPSEASTDTEEATFGTIAAAIRGAATAGVRVTLKPEKFASISL
jgi:hypothetical protein